MRNRLLGILACGVVTVAACQSSAPSPAPPIAIEPSPSAEAPATSATDLAVDQVLRIDTNLEPPTLDPTLAADATSVVVLRALHRGLVTLDHDSNVVPELASSWDVSSDARTITFHLKDARYGDGHPIVAGDLVYSWRRLVDPRTAAPYAYVMAEVDGAAELLGMAGADPAPSDATVDAALDKLGVSAPDERTFVVHLATPATYFLAALTLWVFAPMQQQWIEGRNATEAANYVSSGPFALNTWKHDSEIVLRPNPYWYGDPKPSLTEIQMSIVPEPATQQAAYEVGEIDMVQTPDPDVQRVRNDPVLGADYRETAMPPAINYYSFNSYQDPSLASYANPGPTANRDFRIALTQAIDKQALIDTTYAGLGKVADSVIMPGIPGYQPDLNPYPYDLASARAHMDSALLALHKNAASELGKLTIGYPSGHGQDSRVAFLAEAWRQAFGLQTEQVGSDLSVFETQRHLGEYDISFNGWGADYPHANNQLSGLFTCRGGNNDNQYCNPAFDSLIAKAAAEQDAATQVSIYDEAQTLLMSDAPILPLRFPVSPYEVKPYVSGLTVTPADAELLGDAHFETIRILKH
jgi:oligopeptide transport system substrate-binding protein